MPVPSKLSSAANTQLTISNTSVNLWDTFVANSESNDVINGDVFTLNVESAGIRLFWDGNTPTTTLGIPIGVGGTITLKGVPAKKINMIRSTGSDAKVNVQSGVAIMSGIN